MSDQQLSRRKVLAFGVATATVALVPSTKSAGAKATSQSSEVFPDSDELREILTTTFEVAAEHLTGRPSDDRVLALHITDKNMSVALRGLTARPRIASLSGVQKAGISIDSHAIHDILRGYASIAECQDQGRLVAFGTSDLFGRLVFVLPVISAAYPSALAQHSRADLVPSVRDGARERSRKEDLLTEEAMRELTGGGQS